MIRSTATAGVRSTRSGTPARFPARPLAPPNPAAAASRSRGAGTRPANPASERRCAESTKCLPALCGRWPVAAHPAGAWVASEAEAESFPTARRSAADRIVSWALAGRNATFGYSVGVLFDRWPSLIAGKKVRLDGDFLLGPEIYFGGEVLVSRKRNADVVFSGRDYHGAAESAKLVRSAHVRSVDEHGRAIGGNFQFYFRCRAVRILCLRIAQEMNEQGRRLARLDVDLLRERRVAILTNVDFMVTWQQ